MAACRRQRRAAVSGYRARVTALQALVAGSKIPARHTTPLLRELEEVYVARRVSRVPRRLLLQVLHSTRGLDGSLNAFIAAAGEKPGTSLGRMLTQLESKGLGGRKLPNGTAAQFQKRIVDERNRFMHQADVYPTHDGEIATLLSEMHACLTQVFRL